MGNRTSRPQRVPADAPKCHYDLLGIELTASPDEIKQAYRRKALLLHPGKNLLQV